MKKLIKVIIGVAISILICSLILMGMSWLFQKPFPRLGWIQIIIDLLDYSQCHDRIDYFAQSLLLFVTLGVPAALSGMVMLLFDDREQTIH